MNIETAAARVSGTLDPLVVRRLSYADQMRKLVPHSDHASVQYALAVAAKHFGLYSPKTAMCDVCASLWGKYIDHRDATRGRRETVEEMMGMPNTALCVTDPSSTTMRQTGRGWE